MLKHGLNYALEFDEHSGGLKQFYDAEKKPYLASEAQPLAILFLLDDAGNIFPVSTSEGTCVCRETEEGVAFDYEVEHGLRVAAAVRISPDDGFAHFSMTIENHGDCLVDSVDYPVVVARREPGRKLFWSAMEGVEISDFALRDRAHFRCYGQAYPPRGWEGAYPNACQTSFMSLYDGESGLYFGCHDSRHNFKMIEWQNLPGGVKLMYKLYPGSVENKYVYDFEIVMGSQGGNWYDSAELYRDFIFTTDTVRLPKLTENRSLPAWLFSSPIVVAYCVRGTKDTGDMSDNCYFPYLAAKPHLDALKEKLGSNVMALLMHWEGTAPWAPPYVWPPYGGAEVFNEFVEQMHRTGDLVGVYCSGIGWTQQSGTLPSYDMREAFEREHLAACMQLGPRRELEPSTVCGWPIRRGYNMCPTEEQTVRTVVGEVKKIAEESRVDYIQFFDQNVGGNAYACYSRSHRHPPLPGRWISESMKALIDRIRSETGERTFLLGCEAAAAEPFLNDLFFNDLRYNINYFFGTPVPAYNFIFGEYVKNFMGNQNTSSSLLDLKRETQNIYMRYAYSFTQGDILTVVLAEDGKVHWDWGTPWTQEKPEQEPLLSFIKLLNDWRKNNAYAFLNGGKMIKPLETDCEIFEERLVLPDSALRFPGVFTARYLAGEGDAQIFTNYLDRPQSVRVRTKGAAVEVFCRPSGDGRQILTDEFIAFELPARSVMMMRILK